MKNISKYIFASLAICALIVACAGSEEESDEVASTSAATSSSTAVSSGSGSTSAATSSSTAVSSGSGSSTAVSSGILSDKDGRLVLTEQGYGWAYYENPGSTFLSSAGYDAYKFVLTFDVNGNVWLQGWFKLKGALDYQKDGLPIAYLWDYTSQTLTMTDSASGLSGKLSDLTFSSANDSFMGKDDVDTTVKYIKERVL